jgi:hypothetical protein
MMTSDAFGDENARASNVPDSVSDFLALVTIAPMDEPEMLQAARNARRHRYSGRIARLPAHCADEDYDDEAREEVQSAAVCRMRNLEIAAALRRQADVLRDLVKDMATGRSAPRSQ